MKFKPPKSDLQEVLYLLLTEGYVSCISIGRIMHGFRTRVSELKNEHNLRLITKDEKGVNRYGHNYIIHVHRLDKRSIKKATELYHKITTNEKTKRIRN